MLLVATFAGVGTAANVGVYYWTRTITTRDSAPPPRPVRLSFMLFVATLVPVSLALMLQAGYVFPRPLNPRSSVVYGLISLSTSVYFPLTVARPSWHNATGQLIGFLVYDLVLIRPLLGRLADVADEHRLSLYVYLMGMVYCGGLATYYLIVNRSTRLWSVRPALAELATSSAASGSGR